MVIEITIRVIFSIEVVITFAVVVTLLIHKKK
jgi:hypothetical protein